MGGINISKRINVRWGDFSLVQCEMCLFEFAKGYDKFDYFHLLSGVDLPIKPINYILNFFELNKGFEFLRVADTQFNVNDIYNKVNYYHMFMPFSRTKIGKIMRALLIANLSIKVQKIFRISRCAKDKFNLYKGYEWCSLTYGAVQYLLSSKDYIFKRFRYTSCADEIYKQTLLMNSSFKSKLYCNINNTAMREIDWTRGNPYVWEFADKNYLINVSNNLFARKFSSSHKEIIDYIDKHV